jgi:hypothetical protein
MAEMVKRAAGLVVAVPFDLVSQPRKDGSSAEYFDLILRSRWPRYECRSHPQDLRTRLSATEEDKFGLFQEMSCERSSRGNVAHMKGNLGGAVHQVLPLPEWKIWTRTTRQTCIGVASKRRYIPDIIHHSFEDSTITYTTAGSKARSPQN